MSEHEDEMSVERSDFLDSKQFLLVDIGESVYGLPVEAIQEVIESSTITPIPMLGQLVKGVINVRGSVIPVIDLMLRLELKQNKNYDKYSCVILYERYDPQFEELYTVGLLVHRVRAIEALHHEELIAPANFGAEISRRFIWNLTATSFGLCTLLEMNNVLDVGEINHVLRLDQARCFANYSW